MPEFDEIKILQLKALQATANGVVIVNTDGIIQWVNPAFTVLTGYEFGEAVGQSTKILKSGKQDTAFYKDLWDTVLTGKVWHGRMINRKKSGEFYTEEQTITPISDVSGNINNFVAIKQDVTKEAVLEEELKRDKAKDKAIFSSIGDGLIVTDEKGNIIQVNEAFEKLLGWAADEVKGKNMLEVILKVDEKDVQIPTEERSLYKVLNEGLKLGRISSVAKTHAYIRKDGSKLPITGEVSPIIIDDKITGAVQVFRDASMDMRIDKAKTEFVSLASHELRTPLTAIDGLVSMIRDGEYGQISEELKQPLEDISTSSERLIHLVNDLLDISRIQTGKLKYMITDFPVTQVINETVGLLQPVIKQRELELIVGETEDIKIQADADKVKQILNNLIGNALKFTDKGTIKVSCKTNIDRMEILVTDSGIGISKEDQVKLFGKFEQLGAVLGRPMGTGLGLYISKEIAQKMGGDVWVIKSEPGTGSTFAFSVPVSGTELAGKLKKELMNAV